MSRLDPHASRLHVVRWERCDGRTVKHKYFIRRHDAVRFLERLQAGGWTAALYSTSCTWTRERP